MVQELPVQVERRLSAILAADVAGYSRLMHNDEGGDARQIDSAPWRRVSRLRLPTTAAGS
jgi:hypothetical protein